MRNETPGGLKLLLDTHIWLWSLLEPSRLSRRVARALSRPDTEIWLSPIAVWEILTLCQKRRLILNPDAATWISAARAAVPFREASVTHDVALATAVIRLPHRDPADRFLAATAATFGLTLVTADENLLSGSGFRVLANR